MDYYSTIKRKQNTDTCNKNKEPPVCEGQEADPKEFILHDFIDMIFSKRQNYRDKIRSTLVWTPAGEKRTRGFLRQQK